MNMGKWSRATMFFGYKKEKGEVQEQEQVVLPEEDLYEPPPEASAGSGEDPMKVAASALAAASVALVAVSASNKQKEPEKETESGKQERPISKAKSRPRHRPTMACYTLLQGKANRSARKEIIEYYANELSEKSEELVMMI